MSNLRLIRLYFYALIFTFWFSQKRFNRYTECINTPALCVPPTESVRTGLHLRRVPRTPVRPRHRSSLHIAHLSAHRQRWPPSCWCFSNRASHPRTAWRSRLNDTNHHHGLLFRIAPCMRGKQSLHLLRSASGLGARSVLMSMSVCLSRTVCLSASISPELQSPTNFVHLNIYGRGWGSILRVVLRYAAYFRCYGWCHICISATRDKGICWSWPTTGQYRITGEEFDVYDCHVLVAW